MKKIIFISTAILFFTMPALAQLKLDSNGNLSLQVIYEDGVAKLNVGDGPYRGNYYYYNGGKVGTHVHSYSTQSGNNYGVVAEAWKNGTNGNSVGVFGHGSGASSGLRNYGVAGTIDINAVGAGICGTTEGNIPPASACNGSYAGYFYGDTYADGTLTVTYGFYNLSDMRLKDDVVLLSKTEDEKGTALDNLQRLDVLEYAMKDVRQMKAEEEGLEYEAELSDQTRKDQARRHYGLSAQELQKVYPELVRESQEGFLTVNYTELVPILIRSIQELKQQVDELSINGSRQTRAESYSDGSTVGSDFMPVRNGCSPSNAVLYQNTPNPFTAQTEIRFSLPDDAPQSFIYIFDMNGRMQKQIPVDASMQSVTINGYELQAGIYLYSLVIGGQEIDTKRMILSK